ncbi:MAG: site-2 protease family protein [Weeksellaceae bacterium]
MLSYLFSSPIAFVLSLIGMVVAITIHEFAHAKTADMLGDPTPRLQGRITLDPRAHLDLYGTLLLIIIGFGWGKPVQFDPFNLKNPRKDAAIISIAGPIANILLATLLSIILRLFIFFDAPIVSVLGQILFTPMILVNLMLAVFNMIPVHPLDGFKIVGGLLSREQARSWYQLERYGFVFLLMLIVPFGGQSMVSGILNPILDFLSMIFLP